MEKPYVEATVKGVGEILRFDASFDVNMQAMRKAGVRNPLTARELAYARIHAPNGKESTLATRGSYTRAGFVYAPNESPIRVQTSMLLNSELAKLATEVNRSGRYFSIENIGAYESFKKMAEKDKNREPEKRRAIILPSRKVFPISSTSNLEVFANIFGSIGQEYLNFLGFSSLNVYPVDVSAVDAQKGAILTQEWLARVVGSNYSNVVGNDISDVYGNGNSNVDGNVRYLDNDDTVRGVSVTGEASRAKSPSVVLPYTQRDVERTLRVLEGVRNGNLPASKLEKAIKFAKKLRETN